MEKLSVCEDERAWYNTVREYACATVIENDMNGMEQQKPIRGSRSSVVALVFAGGVGRRMHSEAIPKQFLELYGKPIIVRTLEVFETHPEVEGIVVACVAEWMDRLTELASRFRLRKLRSVVPGGTTGHLSIRNGLKEWKRLGVSQDTFVMIHDGVRPLVTVDDLTRNLAAARVHGGAVTTGPAVETIALVGNDGLISRLVPREKCRLARAPQTFRLGDLLKAHEIAEREGQVDIIDTLTLMQNTGFPSATAVEGTPENIKITTPQDFLLFKQIIEAREAQRGWVL